MTGAPSSTKSTHYHLTTNNNNTRHSIMNTHTYIPYINI